MTNHTPTPWTLCRETDEFETLGTPIMRILDEHGDDTPLVIGMGSDFGPNDVKADTAFILRAVNSHDALIEACRTTIEACTQEWLFQTNQLNVKRSGNGVHASLHTALCACKEALAKALPQEQSS